MGLGAAGGAVASHGEGAQPPGAADEAARTPADGPTAFYGEHQGGIATPPQDHLQFAAFDADAADAAGVRDLLRLWSQAAAQLTAGRPAPRPSGDPSWNDSGEALGHAPARLTVTVGLGPGLFSERFGLSDRRPDRFAALPAFVGDDIDPRRSGGDLALQICADDPQVAFHALHTLTRIAHGAARVRWVQSGFRRSPRPGATPRNLLGFMDGSRNVDPADRIAAANAVWASDGWMRGGTFLAYRRVRTVLDVWDVTSPAEQERVIGRDKASGAPLGGRGERDRFRPANLPVGSHVREAAPESNGGATMLRRGYNYSDGYDPATGQLDAGLVFISLQRSLEQFVRVQRRLAGHDALNKHVLHTGSAVFAVPPGARRGGFVGESLFAA